MQSEAFLPSYMQLQKHPQRLFCQNILNESQTQAYFRTRSTINQEGFWRTLCCLFSALCNARTMPVRQLEKWQGILQHPFHRMVGSFFQSFFCMRLGRASQLAAQEGLKRASQKSVVNVKCQSMCLESSRFHTMETMFINQWPF